MGFFIPSFTMQRTLMATVAASALLTLAGTAQAQTADLNTYVEVGYSRLAYKDDFGLKTSPGSLTTTIGYRAFPHVAFEGNIGFALGSDDLSFNGAPTGISAKFGTNYGIFVRPNVEVVDGVELFGRVGWQRVRMKLSFAGSSGTSTDNDLAYGFGVNYHLNKSSYLQASWMNHYSKDGASIKGLGVAYGYRF